MARKINGIDEITSLVGERVGVSEWHTVTQEQVNLFAEATGDHQWIHVDPERAKSGPFGGPIAHGYLTISLAPALLNEVAEVENVSMGVNYGINRLRFPAPLPVGGRVRMSADVSAVDPFDGGAQVTWGLTFEVEGQDKPCCVAEAVYRMYR